MVKYISFNLQSLQDACIIKFRSVELNLPIIKPARLFRRKREEELEKLDPFDKVRDKLGIEIWPIQKKQS